MKKTQWKKGRLSRYGALLWGPLLFVVIALLALSSLSDVEQAGEAEAIRLLTDNLNRATLTCYAIEGVYPPTLEYLTAHYGVRVDASRYAVHYTIFADNIMPDITVIALYPSE